jgi:hypothetical protein
VVTSPLYERMDSEEFLDIHRPLELFWQSATVPHLDLLPVYAELPIESLTVNFYDTHPNEFAHELAAREIADFLERRISLESP